MPCEFVGKVRFPEENHGCQWRRQEMTVTFWRIGGHMHALYVELQLWAFD